MAKLSQFSGGSPKEHDFAVHSSFLNFDRGVVIMGLMYYQFKEKGPSPTKFKQIF